MSHNPETSEDRMKRWLKILDDKVGEDLDNFYDEVDMLISGASISDEFKSDIVAYNIQCILIRL
jgi:predicted dinucleotide-utilizing enzyme